MNILFLTSPAPIKSGFWTTEKRPPIGLGYLMAVLKRQGHTIFFSDEYLSPSNILDTDYLELNKIDFVGIYSNTVCYQSTLQLLEKIELKRKNQLWHGKILIGGPHTSVGCSEIPEYVDHIVIGEGEVTVPKIINGEITTRINIGETVEDMDSLPMPAWEEFVNLPYDWSHSWHQAQPLFTFNTSRGCPFSCSFCSVKAIWGKTYRYMSAERVVQDIEHVVNSYGAKAIYFREDHFTLNKQRTTRFCELLIEKKLNIEWICETRADQLVDYDYQKLMYDAGCRAYYIGVESGSPRMLEFYNKQISLDGVAKAFEIAREVGIKTYASLIFGFPTETEEDVRLTNDLIEKIKPDYVGKNVFVGLPGSECYDYIKQNRLYEFEDANHILYPINYLESIKKYYSNKEYFHVYQDKDKIDWSQKSDSEIPSNSEQKPLVSVVMSVFNAEKYIHQAVESILRQTYKNLEFIVINDGSTDGTRDILESFEDSRITFIHQDNVGITQSLNKGIALAHGKYVARQDADDISKPERLEKQVAFLEGHPQVGLLGSRFEFIDEDGDVKRQSFLPTDNDTLQERLTKINQFCHASVIMRKEALDKVGAYSEFFRYAQDYDLWLRISEHYEIANLPEMLVQYRELNNAISSEKILLQSRYAWAAAQLAQQRRATGGTDDTIQASLPMVKEFSHNLKMKLVKYYAQNPTPLISGLNVQETAEDMESLVRLLCTEYMNLDNEINTHLNTISDLNRSIRHNDDLIRHKDDVIRQKDEAIQQRDDALKQKADELQLKAAEIAKLDEFLQERNNTIRAREARITDLLNSLSWKITKPLRSLFSIVKK